MNEAAQCEALVVGIGNMLRADDAFGRVVADRLIGDPRLSTSRVLSCHQLTPELAADFASSRLVVLVDARLAGGRPGSLQIYRLDDHCRAARFDHGVEVSEVVALCEALYGAAPPVVVLSVRAERLDVSESLSATVAEAVQGAVETVVSLLDAPWGGELKADRGTRAGHEGHGDIEQDAGICEAPKWATWQMPGDDRAAYDA
jgi:hydrogenase maturation protease